MPRPPQRWGQGGGGRVTASSATTTSSSIRGTCLDRETREGYPGALAQQVGSSSQVRRSKRSSGALSGAIGCGLTPGFRRRPTGLPRRQCFVASYCRPRTLSVERAVFWDLGGFDEAFPYAGAEDQALSLDTRAAGLPLVRNHGMRVRHNDQILSFRRILRSRRAQRADVRGARRSPSGASGAPTVCRKRSPLPRTRSERDQEDREVVAQSKSALRALHTLVAPLEQAAPERALGPAYRLLLGLHIHRGVRMALRRSEPQKATNASLSTGRPRARSGPPSGSA